MERTSKNGSNEATRILIVDDHPLVRRGLNQLINEQPRLNVCAEAANQEEAVKAVQAHRPDLAIVDMSLGKESGLDLIETFQARSPDLPILVLSMHEETFHAERVIRAGAKGYIMKGESLHHLTTAIDKVLGGGIYLSEKMQAQLAERVAGKEKTPAHEVPNRLSDREFRVFELIGEGLGPKEIAQKLHLSVKTIETYRSHLKEKLNLESAPALRKFAIQWKANKA